MNFAVYVPKIDENFVGSLAVVPLQLIGIIMIVMIMSFFKDLKTYIIEKNRDDEKANK